MPEGLARIASRNLVSLGAIANLVEYPAVPQGAARYRVQVMADHSREDVDQLIVLMQKSLRMAEETYRPYRENEIHAAAPVMRAGPAASAA